MKNGDIFVLKGELKEREKAARMNSVRGERIP